MLIYETGTARELRPSLVDPWTLSSLNVTLSRSGPRQAPLHPRCLSEVTKEVQRMSFISGHRGGQFGG